jgi:hypothetical protein
MLHTRIDGKFNQTGLRCLKPLSTLDRISGQSIRLLKPVFRESRLSKRVRGVRKCSVSSIPKQAELVRDGKSIESQKDALRVAEGADGGEKVVTTFRWPAALDGKDVSVVGNAFFHDFPVSNYTGHVLWQSINP